MTRFLLYLCLILHLASCGSAPEEEKHNGPERPNVLFIAVDDLRPELGCYGHPFMKTPNIDALAAAGTVFTNAYCNVPVCGASRASIMTGIRPARDRFVDYDCRIETDVPDAPTIHGFFRDSGYHAVGLGKILHFPDDTNDDWSEPQWRPDYENLSQTDWRNYQLPENRAISESNDNGAGPPFERADVPDNAYHDGMTAERAAKTVRELAAKEQPFFLAVGFLKPHLPFNAPEKYWALYDDTDIEMPQTYYRADGTPDAIYHNSGELRFGYAGVPEDEVLPEDYARQLIQGYYAATSYMDANVGRVLDALEASGEADNTIIVLWGDHGWNLGDHTMWCKHSVFNTSLRVPLIIRAPGFERGQVTAALSEYVDVFPTLAALSGLERPSGLDGESLVGALSDPVTAGKEAVFTRWKNADNVTTKNYSYAEWVNDDGQEYARVLFDHRTDSLEVNNVVNRPDMRPVVKQLSGLLKASRRIR